MGRAKQFQIEMDELEREEYIELKEMGIAEKIKKLEEELVEKKELKLLNDDEEMLNEDIIELEKELIEKQEQLDTYNELQERYYNVGTESDED